MLRRFLLLIVLSLLLVSPVAAREVLNGETCIIEPEQTIDGTLFAFCETLQIHGTVNGDVYGATIRTIIDGTVNGNVYLAAAQMDLTGQIIEDLHFGGIVLRLNPPGAEIPAIEDLNIQDINHLSRSVKAITLSTTLYDNAVVDEGILTLGYQLVMRGNVDNEINFWGSTLIIDGDVLGNVYATVGDPDSDSSQIETLLLPLKLDLNLENPGLIIGDKASILGNLEYWGPSVGEISTGAVTGETAFTSTSDVLTTLDEPGAFNLYLDQFGREFTTLLVIGILALLTMNKLLQSPLGNLRVRPFASLAVGMLGFLLSFPIVMIVLLLSLTILGFFYLIGLQAVVVAVGIVLGLVNIAGISVFYFVAIFGARALVCLAFGRAILRLVFGRNDLDEKRWLPFLALLIGVGLVSIVAALPVIGILVNAMALFLGLGAILNVVIASFRRVRDAAPSPSPIWYTPSPAILRERRSTTETGAIVDSNPPLFVPPPIEEQTKPPLPGAQNLPEGFDWSFFED
jgi:hypothetical protein